MEDEMRNACRVKLRIAVCFSAIFFLLACCSSLSAQNSRGTILGHIADPSGAAVPGAQVTVRNVNTGVANQFTTGPAGDYTFVNLNPGTYSLAVEKAGFRTTGSSGLILEVDQTLRQDFTLEVGHVSQEVTVTAATQMVQTDNTTVGNVMSHELLENLPVNGRDFTELLSLDAGATIVSGGNQLYWNLHGLGGEEFHEVSLDGARPDSVAYLVDGVTNNGNFFSVASNIPNLSAIQEFKLQDGLYSAEYGQGSGQVNIAIRSGTNSLHGSAYDYLQNAALQPSNPAQAELNTLTGSTTPTKSPLVQNQFGGTLGGPLVIPKLYNGRDKTFWFFSFEGGRRSTTSGTTSPVMVPTDQERQGNFADWPVSIYDPSTTNLANATTADPTGRTVFSGNQIPSSEFDPVALKLLNYYPHPNIQCAMPCQNYVLPVQNTITTNTETMRVDENFGSRDRVFFTGNIRNDLEPSPSMLPASGSINFSRSRLFGLSWQHSFGPTTINEARVGYNRLFYHEGVSTAFGADLATELGIKNSPKIPAFYDIPVVSPNDLYSGIGNSNNGYTQRENDFQYVDNLKLVRGRHNLTVGADIRRIQMLDQDGWYNMGNLSFTGAYTAANPNATVMSSPNILPSGNPFADFLLGFPQGVTAPAPLGSDLMNLRGTNLNFFVQDDFHVTPHLTLNLGLRYEIPSNYHSANASGFGFNPANGGSMVWASKAFVQATTQAVTAAGGQVNTNWLQCCAASSLVPIDKHDFAPRIGIAWRPFSTDRFVVRAGYGIFYDLYERFFDASQFDDNLLWTLAANPMYATSGTGKESASPFPLDTLWATPATSASLFSTATPFYDFGPQVNNPANHNPYTQQWTLDTQYSLSRALLLDVGYVGSHAIHEPTQNLFNTAYLPPVAGDACNSYIDASMATAACLADPNFVPVDKREPFSNFGPSLYFNDNRLESTYNALQVRLRQRFSQGLQYTLNYTFSKALDETSAINNISGTNDFIMDPHNPKRDYGPASTNQTNRFVATGSYDVPIGRGKRLDLHGGNRILGNWTFSGIYSLASGFPFSVYGFPYANWGAQDQEGSYFWGRVRANVVSSPTSGFSKSIAEWYNTAAFAAPPLGTYGDEGKGILTGPHFADLDMSIAKNFLITERHRLQYRLDIFNLGSSWHSSMQSPDNRLTDCNYGSLVGCNALNGTAYNSLNLWTPRTLQMSLTYSF
jgi:hypothetical protein